MVQIIEMMQMQDLFVSTSCLGGTRDLQEILEIYSAHGIKNVELSGGLDCTGDAEGILKKHSHLNFIIHNYFPPVSYPFIMNLASQDAMIRERSVAICKKAIDLCAQFRCRLYSFHPGFRVEKTLGLNFEFAGERLVSYEAAFEKFAISVEDISAYAKIKGVKIALENLEHKNEAYMMTRPEEFSHIQDIFPEVGVLLDLGHLKIASKRLGFRIDEFIRAVQDNILEVHIHENDGKEDLHWEPLKSELMELLLRVDCQTIVLESRNLSAERIILNLRALEEACIRI
ncbi:MAG: endonuclease IV [Methanosaeta sp. PtaU1.Bin112]|nr:MAG: endonuclease IV [Methanosaeta sp. PtaU1.Bin112]